MASHCRCNKSGWRFCSPRTELGCSLLCPPQPGWGVLGVSRTQLDCPCLCPQSSAPCLLWFQSVPQCQMGCSSACVRAHRCRNCTGNALTSVTLWAPGGPKLQFWHNSQCSGKTHTFGPSGEWGQCQGPWTGSGNPCSLPFYGLSTLRSDSQYPRSRCAGVCPMHQGGGRCLSWDAPAYT